MTRDRLIGTVAFALGLAMLLIQLWAIWKEAQ